MVGQLTYCQGNGSTKPRREHEAEDDGSPAGRGRDGEHRGAGQHAHAEPFLDDRQARDDGEVSGDCLRRLDLRRLLRIDLAGRQTSRAVVGRRVPLAAVERRHRSGAPCEVGRGRLGHLQQQDRRRAFPHADGEHPRRDVRDVRQRRSAGAQQFRGAERDLQLRSARHRAGELHDLHAGGDAVHQRQRQREHHAQGGQQPLLPGLRCRQRAEQLHGRWRAGRTSRTCSCPTSRA